MKKTRLLAALLCLPTLLIAQLQLEIAGTEQFSFEQGLSDQEIYDIHRDARGILWMGTRIGIERYDGYRFESYNDSPKRKQPLHGKSIAQIGESDDGYLYLQYQGNFKFIDLFHTDRLDCKQVFLNPTTGIDGVVQDLSIEEQGDFFVLTSLAKGLAVWKLNTSHLFEKVCFLPYSIAEGETFRLLKSKSKGFWVYGSRQGLFRTDTEGNVLQRIENKSFITYERPAAKGKVLEPRIFYEDRAGRFWLSFKNVQGVFLFQKGENGNIEAQSWQGFPRHEYFSQVWEDGKGNLLFKSPRLDEDLITSKLLGLNAKGETFDAASLVSVGDKILYIYGLDFERQVFLGTHSGIYKISLKNKGIRHYLSRTLKPGQYGAIMRSIVSDGRGNLFFALEGLWWFHLDTRSDHLDTIVLRDAKGKALRLNCSGQGLAYDPDGALWGTSCGAGEEPGQLHRYDLVRKTTQTWNLHDYLAAFCRSRDGRLCLLSRSASEQGGSLLVFDPSTGEPQIYADADGTNPFAERTPRYILENRSRDGVFWVGTKNGLVAVDLRLRVSRAYGVGEKNEALNFSNSDILVTHQDEDGLLWLGTNGGGLNILHFEKENIGEHFPRPALVEVVDKTHGLCNNMVCGILPAEDGEGSYILSTEFGLSIFNPHDKTVGNFYKQDGLNENEFNRFSFLRDESGRFYFGTINGLNAFRLEDLLQKNPGTKIHLTKLTKYFGWEGQPEEQVAGLDHLAELVIGPEVSSFQLDFMLTDYSDPQKNQFYVWLEGQDTVWRYLGNTSFLRYNHNRLPAGHYTLHLRGTDSKGNLAENTFTLNIRSKVFFYETSWFLSLLVLCAAGAVFAFSRWRIVSIRARKKWRIKMNQRFAELELKALQAQMNPHFIFNSLGAIQYFIRSDRTEEANGFLTKFAQLMRLFLESSKSKYITLAEEMRLLKLYVELEKMRFEGRFEAMFSIDENIDMDEVEIPSMLLQPFVENAINHGLFHKKEKGLLQIKVSANGSKEIHCIVEDDGVGREAAGVLREQSQKNYKSRAMQIVHERLEALSQVEGYEVKIEVEDLHHPNSSPAGTRVSITIPLAR
ncbi:MAG: histidine kinase [Saprospiraceae bacterium]